MDLYVSVQVVNKQKYTEGWGAPNYWKRMNLVIFPKG